MKKIWIGIGVILIFAVATMFNIETPPTKKEVATSEVLVEEPSEVVEVEKEDPETVTKQNYDKIIIGDIVTGEGGMTIEEVEAILGDPDEKMESSNSMDGESQESTDLIWFTGDFQTVSVNFINGKAIYKLWQD